MARSKPLRLEGFKLDQDSSMPMRYAAILLYAKQHHPGVMVPRTLMFKIANMRNTQPQANGREVRSMSGAFYRAKQILRDDFHEEILTAGDSVRLLETHEERLRIAIPREKNKLRRASHNLATVVQYTDLNQIGSSPELDALKKDARQLTRIVVKQINDPVFQASLALPELPKKEKKDEGEKVIQLPLKKVG